MHENPVPLGTITLAAGQNWQVLTAFGEPDKVYEILGVAQPDGVWYKTTKQNLVERAGSSPKTPDGRTAAVHPFPGPPVCVL